MITYPARPTNGGCLTRVNTRVGWGYRPKLDGSRVLMDVAELMAFNRQGDRYSKEAELPWKSCEYIAQKLDVRYLDVEHLVKHKHNKGKIALLDTPERDEATFSSFLAVCKYKLDPPDYDFGLDPYMAVCRADTMFGFETVSGFPRLDVVLLPCFECNEEEDVPLIRSMWDGMRNWATELMKKNGETTPYVEGMVGVKLDSPYPLQIRSSREKTPDWVKHRYAT